MRVGRRHAGWVGNCVSIGLSSGFLEPLESTGIYFIQKAVDLLTTYFPDRTFHEALIRSYNQAIAAVYEEVRDFIVLHYLLSRRDDQPFWRDCRHVPIPDSLHTLMALYEESGIIEPSRTTGFTETSYHHIFSGGRLLPRRHNPRADAADVDEVYPIMDHIRRQNQALCHTLPTHQELMQWLHKQPLPTPL
jgi:tryptophan halogenase